VSFGAGCLAMMISITTSGGIGGFGLARSAEVEVEGLPEPLQEEACARLDPEALRALPSPRARGMADSVVYHIVVEEAGQRTVLDVPEGALPAETLDLIDRLMERTGGGQP
jgi:hypothetical protein